jgi:hypothetical protein
MDGTQRPPPHACHAMPCIIHNTSQPSPQGQGLRLLLLLLLLQVEV